MEQSSGREDGVVNVYKDYSKVFTPLSIGKIMVDLLELEPHHSLLEPSAGLGWLMYAIQKRIPNMPIYYYELNETHATQLFLAYDNARFIAHDFILDSNTPRFDRIIANPPFDEDKWLLHTAKMYKCLNSGGILVTLAPQVPVLKTTSLDGFKARMKELGAERFPVDNWHVNKDGTKTPIHIIKIRKP